MSSVTFVSGLYLQTSLAVNYLSTASAELPILPYICAKMMGLSGIGMSSPILWSHLLKMQRIVLLNSLLWWEIGTNSLITGPGEWLSFRWAYSIPTVCRPSVVVLHTFKLEYLWSQLASLDQILCVASLGLGKGCIMFWGRLDQNFGIHGNRKPVLTYNEENGVSTFSQLLLIQSFLYLQVTKTCIKSRKSVNFGQVGPLTTELTALEHLKNFP